MLSIGEFSKICKVSTKTLRYYAEIGLILPDKVNTETGYRYYSVGQLETMLLINRLKSYHFSLEEIKKLLQNDEAQNELFYSALSQKKKEIEAHVQEFEKTLGQLHNDILNLEQGNSIMSYLEKIKIQLVDVPKMHLLSVRKLVHEDEISAEYPICFNYLLRKITEDGLTVVSPPMVLFHSTEFTPLGLDIEFAIPIKEITSETRQFQPETCLKTVLKGSYSDLGSVYAKQYEYAENEGYELTNTRYEVYVNDPSFVDENELLTEIYYPVKKSASRGENKI